MCSVGGEVNVNWGQLITSTKACIAQSLHIGFTYNATFLNFVFSPNNLQLGLVSYVLYSLFWFVFGMHMFGLQSTS